jgi:hypothetical protein
MLDERMQAGYAALQANDVTRACDLWLKVWEGFNLPLTPATARVRDVDALFHGTEFFFNLVPGVRTRARQRRGHGPALLACPRALRE